MQQGITMNIYSAQHLTYTTAPFSLHHAAYSNQKQYWTGVLKNGIFTSP